MCRGDDEETRVGEGKVKRDMFSLCYGEWVQGQASSAVGLEKIRPVEETITDK